MGSTSAIWKAGERPNQAEDTSEIRGLYDLVESLALSRNHVEWALDRLRCASRYMRSGERGAAQYELRMLMGGACGSFGG